MREGICLWDDLTNFIKTIEPLIIVVAPLVFGIYLKLKLKFDQEKQRFNKEFNEKSQEKLKEWQHSESILVVNRLNELCNFFCDITNNTHTCYIQMENGTTSTNKIYNMFFSCAAEESRYHYSTTKKLTETIQRIPYINMSKWFSYIQNSSDSVVFIDDTKYIDNIFQDVGIKLIVSGFVRNSNNVVTGVCNFVYPEVVEFTQEEKEDIETQMLKFIASVEATFFNYNSELEEKKLQVMQQHEIFKQK